MSVLFAVYGPTGSGAVVQTTFAELTVDTSPAPVAFNTLLSQALTLNAGTKLVIRFDASMSATSNNRDVFFRVLIDGVVKRGVGARLANTGSAESVALSYVQSGLLAGAHTVVIQWRAPAGTVQIRPVAAPDAEHASLICQEVGA